jgi:hypothetical protein
LGIKEVEEFEDVRFFSDQSDCGFSFVFFEEEFEIIEFRLDFFECEIGVLREFFGVAEEDELLEGGGFVHDLSISNHR